MKKLLLLMLVLSTLALVPCHSQTVTVWKTVTSDYTLKPGDHILADTTKGSFNLRLPPSTGSGVEIDVVDPQNTWRIHWVHVIGIVHGDNGIDMSRGGVVATFIDVGGDAKWSVY